MSLRQLLRERSDGDLEQNINSNGPKYGLESNTWDNFISEGIYKESGAHSYPEKKPISLSNGAYHRLMLALQSQCHLVVNHRSKAAQETYSGHITSSIRKN